MYSACPISKAVKSRMKANLRPLINGLSTWGGVGSPEFWDLSKPR